MKRDLIPRYELDAREAVEGLAAFDPQLRRLGLRLRSDMTIGRCEPPAEMRTLLRARSDVIFRRRQVYANGDPAQVSTSYLIADHADNILFAVGLDPGGGYAHLTAPGSLR